MQDLDVIERLRSMQDGASPARALDPAKLWERGTRWRRLRVLVTASVMVCLLVVAGGSGALLVLGDRAPGSAQTTSSSTVPASLPETIYAVPEWAGEIKGVPLAAITMTDRAGWTGRSTGVAGLTAHGHTYGFLDLPAYMGEETLSPDGRRVAYWAAGTPSGDPNTAGGDREPVTAVAVYDVVSDTVTRHEVETEHGVQEGGMIWVDSDTLVLAYGQILAGDSGPEMEQSSSTLARGFVWDLGTGEVREWPWGDEAPDLAFTVARGGRLIDSDDTESYSWFDLRSGGSGRWNLKSRTLGVTEWGPSTALAPDGTFAAVGDGKRSQMPNSISVTESSGRQKWRVLPDTDGTWALPGWRDGDLLAVRTARWEEDDGWTDAPEVVAVDVKTGKSTRVLGFEGGSESTSAWRFASDLLESAPVVESSPPPEPRDPRPVLVLGSGFVVALVAGLVMWRRRVRP